MKILNKMTLVLAVSVLLSSCQKFVDIKQKSSQGIMETAQDCRELLDNYNYMNTGYPLDGEISADDYFVFGESLRPGAVPAVSLEEQALYGWDPNIRRAQALPNWQGPYFVTYNANLVLGTLDKLDAAKEDPANLNDLRGSALFYRGYALWFVAQLYARPYEAATASTDPGVPIRLTADMNAKSSRGTVKQTYDFIIDQLQQALNLLPATSSVATRPNKAAAYAMLARVYLSMGDYPNALSNASAAIQLRPGLINYNTISKSSATPFVRFNPEVIFHSITYYSPGQSPGNILLPRTATTNIAKINRDLVSSYAPADLRSQIFLKQNSGIHAGTYRFTGNYEPASSSSAQFFNGLAADELYLTRAECYARAGNTALALGDLNTLLNMRWTTGNYIPMVNTDPATDTADEVLAKILEERRKELLMRGLRWTDLRRLNKDPKFKRDIIRTITEGGVVTKTYTLPANDLRYTLLIPDQVINNAGLAQNPR